MARFITLGLIDFSIDHIVGFAKPAQSSMTKVMMAIAGTPPVDVRTSPDEIVALLKAAGAEGEFIKLTSSVLGIGKTWMAPRHIVSMAGVPQGTALMTANARAPETVRETLAQVREMIAGTAGLQLN